MCVCVSVHCRFQGSKISKSGKITNHCYSTVASAVVEWSGITTIINTLLRRITRVFTLLASWQVESKSRDVNVNIKFYGNLFFTFYYAERMVCFLSSCNKIQPDTLCHTLCSCSNSTRLLKLDPHSQTRPTLSNSTRRLQFLLRIDALQPRDTWFCFGLYRSFF